MIQCTMGFATDKGQRTGAWDEVYYTTHADIPSAMNAWLGRSGNVLTAALFGAIFLPAVPLGRRLGALSDSCYLYYARFSNPDDKTTKAVVYRPNGGQVAGYRDSDNIAQDCASFRVMTANGYAREVRIGGLPDFVASGGTIDPGFVDNFIGDLSGGTIDSGSTSNFLNAWASIGGCVRVRNATIGGPNSYHVLAAAKPDQYGTVQVTLDVSNGEPDVTKNYAMSIRGQPQARGNWLLKKVSTGIYSLIGSERISLPAVINAWLTLRTFIPPTIAICRSLFASAHKLGKKKYQYRGRRSPILIRR